MRARDAYLQCRVQARLGLLPDPATWSRLEALQSLPAFLQESRTTSLGPWTAGISASSAAPDIERRLRRALAGTIAETSRWAGEPWGRAFDWVAGLTDLPLLEHLRRGEPAPEWAATDAAAGDAPDPPAPAAEILARAREGEPLLSAWMEGWRERWPAGRHTQRAGVEALTLLIREHFQAFPLAPPEEAWNHRARLANALRLFSRRHLLEPAAALAYLVLVALCLERLRAALSLRALFGDPEVAA